MSKKGGIQFFNLAPKKIMARRYPKLGGIAEQMLIVRKYDTF